MSSVEQYPDLGYFLVVENPEDTTSTLKLGSYSGISGILKTAHIRVYNKNASAFSYTVQLKVSTSDGNNKISADAYASANATPDNQPQQLTVFMCDKVDSKVP